MAYLSEEGQENRDSSKVSEDLTTQSQRISMNFVTLFEI